MLDHPQAHIDQTRVEPALVTSPTVRRQSLHILHTLF